MSEVSWDQYFIGIAEAVSKRSKCLSHQFGAVAVNDDHCIISTGYNGPPRGYPHCSGVITNSETQLLCLEKVNTLTCPRRRMGYKSGEGIQFCPAAHAERNAVVNAARHGASLKGCTLYVTSMSPCMECAKDIVNAGIKKVIYSNDSIYPDAGITGKEILEKCGVELILLK